MSGHPLALLSWLTCLFCLFLPLSLSLISCLVCRGVGIGYYSFFTTIAGSFMTYIVGVILDAYTSDAALKVSLRHPR